MIYAMIIKCGSLPFDEVLTDLAKHNDVTEKHKTIVNAVRDLILQIVNRRLTNNGK